MRAAETERQWFRTATAEPAHAAQPRVADLMTNGFVKVPSWFTVAAARQVARLKKVDYVLVVEREAVVGLVTGAHLAAAAPTELLARCMSPCTSWLAPENSVDDAWQLMIAQDLACVPVASGAVLMGVITRQDSARARHTVGDA